MGYLCTHAHSQHSALRLNALWALKHLVDGVGPSVKKGCLEQLGSGWLLRLIDYDSESNPATANFYGRMESSRSAASVSFATPSSAANDGMDEDVEMGQFEDRDENNDDEEGNDDDAGDEDPDGDSQGTPSSATAGKMPLTGAPAISTGAGAGAGAGAASTSASVGSPTFQRARFPQTSHERSRTGRLRQAEAKIAALRDVEVNAQRKNLQDDIVIQEQGLDFIRNLIGPGFTSPTPAAPPTSAMRSQASASASAGQSSSASSSADASATSGTGGTDGTGGTGTGIGNAAYVAARDPTNEATEMIDYLFNEFGQDRFFSMLLSKVRPRLRTTRHSARLASGPTSLIMSTDTRVAGADMPRMQQPRAKVIKAVVYILVHIAAGVVRHRQIVVAQTELMRTLMNHFGSRDRGVRVALCHLVSNLTWHDSAADTQAAHQRGLELRKLGADTHLERLRFDPELDVREHAKMAAHLLGLEDTSKDSPVHL